MSGPVHLALFRRVLWALRLRGPAAGDPNAETLHLLVLLVLVPVTFHIGLAEIRDPHKLLISLIGIPMFLSPAMTLVLLRRNAVRAAGVVYLTGMWVAFTAILALNGGIHHVGLAVYIALAVSAAWLFGYVAALWMAGVSLAATLVMAILETKGIGPRHPLPGTAFGVWLLVAESTLMGVVPVSLVLSSLRRALAQSRKAAAELKAHQEHLEELVQLRTTELVEARDQAQAGSQAKSAFLATVSHELRSPLNTILLLSDPAWRDTYNLDEFREDREVIQRSAEHLLHLIDDVLDSARIDAGRVKVENASFDLQQLIYEITDLLRTRAEQKSLDFAMEKSAGLPRFISADAAKLRHILINLLDNAIKYTDHGRVMLRVDSSVPDATGRLLLTFAIADTGVGIAFQDQTKIFQPFSRVGNVAAYKGTGLGLSISRQYVDLMGGSVRLESVLGEGSRFFVDVPVDQVAESEMVPAQSKTFRVLGLAPGQPEFRVLIVEDRTEDRSILRRILEEAGFRVQSVETGEFSLEVFTAWQPHFIWMDRRLPAMDGLEATKRIRAMDGGSDVKIVGMSASVFASEREEMLAAGLDDFVRKPYLQREIFDCMAKQLGVGYRYAESESASVAPHGNWSRAREP
jgi:signal transduction histidine kinase/CheY-like chemotaxis protein